MDYEIQDSGKHREFPSGAKRDKKTGKGRYDLVPWGAVHAVAVHFQKGAEKYAARNWEKGMPVGAEFMDSGGRHYGEFMQGLDDENHLVASIWNLLCAYQTMIWIKQGKLPEELWDLPFPMPECI
jgi:hypothetical protein